MLPFLKKARVAGLIVEQRKPDGKLEEQAPGQDDGDEGLRACAADLIKAVYAKDEAAVAAAFRAAFEILEMQPHAEAPHSYDAQKE